MKTERVVFEKVGVGAAFTHNSIEYRKSSRSYAEMTDNRSRTTLNAYFDGASVVYIPAKE
jgi:hypothetical protein